MAVWPQVPSDLTGNYGMCFGCGEDNPVGLKLSFEWDGKAARAEFTPDEVHQGWSGYAHGGIIACLLDEAMAYAAVFSGVRCITARMEVRLRRMTPVGEPLVIVSSLTRKSRRLVEAEASVLLKDGTPVAEGKAMQYVVSTAEGGSGADVRQQR